MTAEEKLERIAAIAQDPMGGVTDDRFAAIMEVLGEPEPGEVGRIDVSGAMPGTMMVCFATGLEVGSVEHDDLGLLLELTFDNPGGGWAKIVLPDESSEMLATAIVDGSMAAREAVKSGGVERVTGRLWTPGG